MNRLCFHARLETTRMHKRNNHLVPITYMHVTGSALLLESPTAQDVGSQTNP